MEACTIRRDDTNALLKFNFELPISETALQIDCNFLEGTASSLPACLPRAGRLRSERPRLPAAERGGFRAGLRSPGSPPISSPAPPSARRGRERADPAGGGRGWEGRTSKTRASGGSGGWTEAGRRGGGGRVGGGGGG